jgi:hypothetical protein
MGIMQDIALYGYTLFRCTWSTFEHLGLVREPIGSPEQCPSAAWMACDIMLCMVLPGHYPLVTV